MAILEHGQLHHAPTLDDELVEVWTMISELSDQLSENRALSASLYGQAGSIKNQAIHMQTGYVLRRFNMDKTQEQYDAELEHMTAALSAENMGLQHDNKQINTLIKEYEQTLDTVMTNFRNRARDVQEHELSLIRAYESRLLNREEQTALTSLTAATRTSESVTRLSHLLRQILRAHGGEDGELMSVVEEEADAQREPWMASPNINADWAMDRESELARLQLENEELRRMLGVVPAPSRSNARQGNVGDSSGEQEEDRFEGAQQRFQPRTNAFELQPPRAQQRGPPLVTMPGPYGTIRRPQGNP